MHLSLLGWFHFLCLFWLPLFKSLFREKVATYLGSLVQLCCGDGLCKQILLACVGSGHTGWTIVGLLQSKVVCTSQVHPAQAPGCSARVLSQVSPEFCAFPRSKPLRFSGAPQGHRSRWAGQFSPFLGPSCSGNWVLDERTVPGGL